MIKLSEQLKNLLESRDCQVLIGVEIYDRDAVDISSISSPKNAIARFSNTCFTWYTSQGSYDYEAKITEFPSVKTYLDTQQNEAEITLSNVERGIGSGARFVLDNKIKGTWLVIRLIFPDLEDESWVIWWGKCLRPGKIDNKIVSISATQEIGNYKTQIPFRAYQLLCPLIPGKGDCLGNETLAQKTPLFQEMYEKYGTMLCPDRKFSTCVKLGNKQLFQGQVAPKTTGSFSYVPKEDSATQGQKKTKKKKIPDLKTESWSSLNQSESGSEIVNLAFGRSQIAGHPFSWADRGTDIISLQGFCEGKISDFDFIKCRNTELTLGSVIKHLGDYGGLESQGPDSLFGGLSGYNSRLAYLETIVTGSQPENTDDAPLITAVVRGMQVPVPDVNNEYTLLQTSDDPVHILRFLLTDQKYGRIPTYRIADDVNLLTSAYCNELVEDRSQCESIVLPNNEFDQYGVGYRRYRSTSVLTAYTDMYNNNGRDYDVHPDFEEPWVRWYTPFEQRPLLPPQNVIRRRFTVNGALQEKTSLLDFIQKRILPCFRGWLNYNREGKLEIRTREPADTGYIRADIPVGSDIVPINNIKKWRENTGGYLLISSGRETSEIRKVTGVLFSPGCNDMPMSAETYGDVTATVSNITGGSYTSPGIGYIDLSGTPTTDNTIILKFNTVPNDFYISYTTDGIEDLPCVARMLIAHLNANPDFANYLTAYSISGKPNRIYIRCEAGFLKLNEVTEYSHELGDEVLRVQAVFENCSDIYSDNSATFDNILVDSFSWNENESDENINAYTALYTSAVDDFHVAKIIPRTSWDTIESEAELNEEELDLKFVDNYWQAAYITKTTAIENIDGNLSFTWRTGISGFMLEMGDVVAVRHDSGDGEIRYTPVWIRSISYELSTLTTTIEAKLYLSAAWDHRVQSIDPFLTTTLNPNFVPFTPETQGTSGGIGGASELGERFYPTYRWVRDSRYSPYGTDVL